jgi:hypothetical protein
MLVLYASYRSSVYAQARRDQGIRNQSNAFLLSQLVSNGLHRAHTGQGKYWNRGSVCSACNHGLSSFTQHRARGYLDLQSLHLREGVQCQARLVRV